jgi:hypothetical protein
MYSVAPSLSRKSKGTAALRISGPLDARPGLFLRDRTSYIWLQAHQDVRP